MPRKKYRSAVCLCLSILILALATAAFAGDPDSPTIVPVNATKKLVDTGSWHDGFARTSSQNFWLQFGAVWIRVYLGGWLGR
jgi:hypothetical protein